MTQANVFYVYALLDPRRPGPIRYGSWKFDYEPFYIGKGQGNRAKSHLFRASNRMVIHKINKIRQAGLEPIICYKRSNLSEQQALDLEVVVIAKIGRANTKSGPLANFTDGGDGGAGRVWSKQQRVTRSKQAKALWDSRTEEQRLEFSRQMVELNARVDKKRLGRKLKAANAARTPEQRAAISQRISEHNYQMHEQRSTQEKNRTAKLISAAAKAQQARLTEEDSMRIRRKMSKGHKLYRASRTEEHIAVERSKRIASMHAFWNSDRGDVVRKARRKWIELGQIESAKERWGKLPPEVKTIIKAVVADHGIKVRHLMENRWDKRVVSCLPCVVNAMRDGEFKIKQICICLGRSHATISQHFYKDA